ncbi:MAG: amino acid ABC transporter permease [Nitriliruptorales bacterium]|nr:amino acid ABC transporter permease [Nitriliruptorales bacterium]
MTPRQRRRLLRGILYGVLTAGVVTLALVADWPTIQRAFLQPDIAADMFPDVITRAVKNTLLYTGLAFVFGFIIALVLALMKLSPVAPYRWIATVYIELLRGLPALVTLSVFAFGIPIAFGWRFPGGTLGTGSIGLAVVAAAYMAETIRAGIEAVPKGQREAARSLGMSAPRAMATIILPQAIRIVVPPLTNEIVLLIKDTALLFVIGFSFAEKELFSFGRDIASDTFNSTPFTVIAIMYLVITIPLTQLVAWMERRTKVAR